MGNLSGTVGEATLDSATVPNHSHRMYYSDIGSEGRTYTNLNDSAQGWGYSPGFDGLPTNSVGSSSGHTHSLTNVTSNSASSLPPYYALSYIMRIM